MGWISIIRGRGVAEFTQVARLEFLPIARALDAIHFHHLPVDEDRINITLLLFVGFRQAQIVLHRGLEGQHYFHFFNSRSFGQYPQTIGVVAGAFARWGRRGDDEGSLVKVIETKIHDSVGDLTGNKNLVAKDVHEMDTDGKFSSRGYAGAGPVDGKAVGVDVGNCRLPETDGLGPLLERE